MIDDLTVLYSRSTSAQGTSRENLSYSPVGNPADLEKFSFGIRPYSRRHQYERKSPKAKKFQVRLRSRDMPIQGLSRVEFR